MLLNKVNSQNCNLEIKARNPILFDIIVGLQITDKNRKSLDNETLKTYYPVSLSPL